MLPVDRQLCNYVMSCPHIRNNVVTVDFFSFKVIIIRCESPELRKSCARKRLRMQVGRAGYSQTTDYYDVGEVSKMLIEGYSKFAPGDTSARFMLF